MITLDKLTKRFDPKILFENVSMRFDPQKRYALVGANGAGKSTLLKVISGEQESDQGSVDIPKKLRVGVLRQDHFAYEGVRILDTVLMGNQTLWSAMAEKERLNAGEITDEIGMQLAELEGTIGEEDGYTADFGPAEVQRLDGALQFSRAVLEAAGAKQIAWTGLVTTHIQGSCRMGDDPARSVVDANAEAHTVKRLFVGDGSVIPRTLSANPSITIMALASRLAQHLDNDASGYLATP